MPKVTFIAHSGTRHTVEAEAGLSLMRAAIDNNVPGIDGDCGGQCACATCHVFIDAPWSAKTGARTDREDEMLNFAAELADTSKSRPTWTAWKCACPKASTDRQPTPPRPPPITCPRSPP